MASLIDYLIRKEANLNMFFRCEIFFSYLIPIDKIMIRCYISYIKPMFQDTHYSKFLGTLNSKT